MTRIILLLLCLTAVSQAQTATFQVEGPKATLIADWVPKSQELQVHIPKFKKVLENREIKSLTLSFAYCQDPDFIINNFFSQTISVEILYINLDSCKLTLSQLSHLFKHINAQSVRHLHLNLNSVATGQAIGELLGKEISNFDLKSLKLGLMLLKMGDKGVNDLFMHPLSEEIQELSIDFTANKLGPDAFQNFTTFTSKLKPERLRSVQLFVRSNRIEENGTLYIAKGLKNFNQLSIFKLDVYFNHLKLKAVKPINLLVKKMTSLKILTLNFDFNYIDNEGGQLIGNAISTINNLQYLQVGVGTKNFGYNGYNHIVDGMCKLNKLRSLVFRCGVNRIGAKAALKLKTLFKANPNLQYVDLHLIQNMMTDQGLQVIAESLQELPHLITFKLNFGFNEVRGKGAVQLFKTLQQKRVTNLWIGLSNNPITDQIVVQLLPYFERISQFCDSLELEMLYTHAGVSASKKLKKVFEDCEKRNSGRCVLHINTKEENEKMQQVIDDRREQL